MCVLLTFSGDRDVVLRPGFQDSHMRTPFHRVSLPQGHVTDGNNNLDTQPQAPVYVRTYT